MSDLVLLCTLPAERASLAPTVVAAGGTPVIDLTAAPRVSVPAGAWVRVRSRRNVPGTGPVLLAAGGDAAPVRNRETWLEVTEPQAAPEGFAGIVLRGVEAGGPCGAAPGLELLRSVPQGTRVVLDAGVDPADAAAAAGLGAAGVVLSDVLLGLPELGLPPRLSARLDGLEPASQHVVNGYRLVASPLSPVLRRLLGGASFWDLAQGWLEADDPAGRVWPGGLALGRARALAAAHRDIAGLLAAFRQEAPRRGGESARPLAPAPTATRSADAVAIIGLGCRLPGAQSVAQYWDNILGARSAITEVPVERWDPKLFWDPDKSAPDKTYAKIGGFLTGFSFNPRRFRIPPAVAGHIDQVQQTTLESCYDALADAGYKPTPRDKEGRDFDRGRTAVILGNSMGGEVGDDYTVRVRFPAMRAALEQVPGFAALPAEAQAGILAGFEQAVKQDLPTITEDSMPGELSNVVAGRVANAFDLTGANFTVDAACASSMAAVQTAVKGLLDGDFDLVLTGGADRTMGVETYTKFCKIGALSPDHSAPFDASANGFVMGEGAGILLLKRLSDAERDGDRIYAVIRGIGASSDGRGKGITAPNPRGQKLALARAYEQAGFHPADVDLVECHGTSTIVGDKVEVECLSAAMGEGNRVGRGPVRIGSVKSNIGHLKSAAGAAAMIKASLAVHEGVLPPSMNFRTARPDVPFGAVPLQVQTVAESWASQGPRRAGVSAFGFGGTNFHVVLEQHGVAAPAEAPSAEVRPVAAPAEGVPVPAGVWAVSARSRDELVSLLEKGVPADRPYEPAAPVRLAAAADKADEKAAQIKRVLRVLSKDQPPELLRSRGIYLEEEPCDGKLAFMFTGQGSQYIDMGLDLAERYPIVAETFAEADRVMMPELGRPLTDFIRRDPSLEQDVQFERLRATEISQPAVLTVDIGILRLLSAFGVRPDMVAGHSLGEYAAAVAAGMMSFEHALLAVSARGREMAAVQIDDPGRMAGIAAPVDKVQGVLAEIPGYVVCANKNCPTQTVIAGESDAVEAAIEAFRSRGITVYPLPVSHAFHSRIVAPASAPLRKVLERLDVRPPVRPITTNVTSAWYPSEGDVRQDVIDILAKQVASPVEWIAQMERMYGDGARVFVECGPKRALAGFAASILKRRPHRALYTNHPKRGGLQSFHDTIAAMLALGFPVEGAPAAETDLFAPTADRRSRSVDMAGWRAPGAAAPAEAAAQASDFVVQRVLGIAADLTGYAPEELSLEDELEADLGVDTVKQAELVATVRDHFRLEHDPGFRLSDHRTLGDLANYAARRLGSYRPAGAPAPRARVAAPAPAAPRAPQPAPRRAAPAPRPAAPVPTGALPADALQALVKGAVQAGLAGGEADAVAAAVAPALQSLVASLVAAVEAARPAPAPVAAPAPQPAPAVVHSGPAVEIVASGVSVGLPGGTEVFAEDNLTRILKGENRIGHIDGETQDRILGKNITRLHKDPRTGQGTFHPVTEREQVLQLAGRKSAFDLGEWGVDPGLRRAIDVTTELAIAASLEALRDAGIPLVRRFRTTASGKKVPAGWGLPDPLRDTTGIIFASAFPGYTNLLDHVAANGDDGEGRFDRRFLFQVLSMGHSQLAQFIGARGPNTQVNAACASSTQAICMASDWIKAGRCERVIVVGADDVTNDQMMEWIGAGFLVTGAATTARDVEDGALPFDKRRNGMIIGMGAVGVVVERADAAKARGVTPLARLLATRMANSAFHGSRLDRDHIAEQVDAFVGDATREAGVDRSAFAKKALFMSHETYTPARGGSAAAEIDSLRRAFGPAARDIVIANTKGFTGHAMGAGIEDAVALEALARGVVPPVPNLKEPDPELGDLTLSAGGSYDVRYAIRLAAGFGSQLALTAWERVAEDADARMDAAAQAAWLRQATGYAHPGLVVEDRTLRVVAEEAPAAPAPAPVAAAPAAPAAPTGDLLAAVTALIAARTGYGADELEADFELEADLGIDTVKQAEILGELREQYGVSPDVEVTLADTPTIAGLAGWLSQHAAGGAAPADVSVPDASPANTSGTAGVSEADMLAAVTAVIAARTGYGTDELESDFELEADLGIDTVKQAEILGELREQYGVSPDVEVTLADTPTIAGLAGWLSQHASGGAAPAGASVPDASPANISGSAGPSGADVLAAVTAVVAARTGYGTDELESDFELEADLGIDTVKQAEILGELREQFAVSPDAEVTLADTPTIAGLAGWIAAHAGGGAAPVAAPAPAPAPVAPPPAAPEAAPVAAPAALAGDDTVSQVLLEIISEKTGYGVDELEPDFELEADLGIDTVKQAEIFGDVRERLGVAQDPDFVLADHPTIESLVAWLQGQLAAGGAPAEEAFGVNDDTLVPLDEDAPDDTLVPHPADAEVTGAPEGRGLPESFRMRRPVVVPRPLSKAPGRLEGRVVAVLGEGAFADALREEATALGASMEGAPDAVVDASDDVRTAFVFARELDGARPRDWICATRLGSDPSWIDPEIGMRAGARAGLAKALHREWEDCAGRVVDVDPMLDDALAAGRLLGELTAGDGAMEVFLDANVRRTLELQVEEMPPEGGRLQDNAVVVLTGGTRGITARVALELARRGPVKLALLARTGPGAEPLDEAAAKARIKAEIKATGERATPARIEARLRPLRKAEEARANIAEMEALGATVRFFKVDMADPAGVESVLQEVRDALGFIDGVVHGAGLEESRLIATKSDADFSRVFDGKAVGGMAIARNLERVAWFVSMGSVAGRFGNPGQVDYAAANEAMARVCLSRPRSLHVDWTAWGDTGMAVRGGMERLLTERGVELLPAEGGARLLVDMIGGGVTGEVLVAGRLGGFTLPPAHPLLDSVELLGDAAIGRRRMDPATDPWIVDHAIGGTPVLPGVIGLELMAAVSRFARPAGFFMGARDVRYEAPVKLHKGGAVDLIVTAEPIDDHNVRCVLESERTARTGRVLRTRHFSAVVSMGLMEAIDALPPAFFAEEPLSAEAIYQRFFHGPRFQVLAGAESVGETALMANGRVRHADIGDGLVTAPLVLEAAFQAAGLHRMAVAGVMALPASIEQVQLDAVPGDDEPLSVMVRQDGDAYDIDVDGPAGSVLRVRGFRLIDTGPLPDGDKLDVPEGGWPMVVMATATPTSSGGAQALLPAELAAMTARGTERRKADRLAGQRAAVAAVRGLTGWAREAFTVERAPSGAPRVVGPAADVAVSICHRDGAGWAVATRRGRPGLDVEAVALRSGAWLRTWFTDAEQARLAGDPVAQTEAWCAKEAVLKALGTGMALHPREVEVLGPHGARVRVRLHGEAARTHAGLGGGRLEVCLGRVDGLVAAAALLSPGDGREAVASHRVA